MDTTSPEKTQNEEAAFKASILEDETQNRIYTTLLTTHVFYKENHNEEEDDQISVLELVDENGEQFKLVKFEEVVMPVTIQQKGIKNRLSYVKNFPYQDGDVLVSSYPKTGTHWTANLLHYLMYDGPLDGFGSHPPWLMDVFNYEDWPQKREGNRIIASHFPPKRLPTEHFAKGGKTIVVFRNPKDTAVSLFHQLRKFKKFGEFKLSWSSYINYWMDGKVPYGSYFDYYNSWQHQIEQKPEQNVLVVQYEDLKKDSLNQLRRIQNYLGLHHSDARLQAVLDKCSLGNLKADVENGKIKTLLMDEEGKSILYRKGVIGDWKNHFTVAQNEQIEGLVKEKFQDSMFSYNVWNC